METETGNVQENRYDAEGLRFELLENGRRTSFVYHDGELLQEEGREEQGTSYHLGAGMEAFRRGQELSYYHRDEQLSTTFITGGHGDVLNSYQYDAFGMSLGTTEKLNNRIRYTGQQYDELTEQYYLRARYYNPVAGRFMQEDVYQGDGLNLYAYCGNNPVVYDDPSGYKRKACPPQGKISESVDETSYGKSSSNCTELVPYYPANNGAESGTPSGFYQDANGRWHRPNGQFASNTEVGIANNSEHYLHRSYIRQSTIDAVNSNTKVNYKTGQIYDEISRKWVNPSNVELGHTTGNEYWYWRNWAESQGMTQSQFNEFMNNPDFYRWQDITSNRSHIYEDPH